MSEVKVSVICMVFNHSRYIEKALEGFVSQKTKFPFEVIIHDDCSTDGTVEIIEKYRQKYPEILKPIYQSENQWTKANHISKDFIYPQIRGEYVAYCEGDDYWIDGNKLQRQVDFLDSNPDYAICFHPVYVDYEDHSEPRSIYPNRSIVEIKKTYELADILRGNFIQTSGIMYRWRFHQDSYDLIAEQILPGDWYLHILHAKVGKIGMIPEVMSVYRRHKSSIWWRNAEDEHNWYEKCGFYHLNFYKCVEENFKVSKLFEMTIMMANTILAALKLQNFKLLEKLHMNFEECYVRSLDIIEISTDSKPSYSKMRKQIFREISEYKVYDLLNKFQEISIQRTENLKRAQEESFTNNYSNSKAYQLLQESELFDETWYLEKYPDVAAAQVDPIIHYMQYGWKEGRDPSKYFKSLDYLQANTDLKIAKVNPLLHYLQYGRKEGRAVSIS